MKRWRPYLLLLVIFFVAAIILSRLFYIQILNRKFYGVQALGQQVGFQEVQGARGEVFFANSKDSKGSASSQEVKSLAINEETWTLYAIPNNIKDKEAFADTLAKNIDDTKEIILGKLQSSDTYVPLKKELSSKDITPFKKLTLEGLYWESNSQRYYPQEKLAAQVIGFLGGDGNGQYGIEGYYEDQLKGKEGIKEEKSGLSVINASQNPQHLDGSDIFLTIDYNIQFEAELLLAQAKKDINIDSGQIIVLKPDTGKILALANYPQFDPNAYGKETNFDVFQNGATQKIFEPGSVFKPFTMAIALQEGKITPEDTFFDSGSVKIGPDTIYNFDHAKYGQQTMSGILEKSINTGAVFLSQKVSHQTFSDYLHKFGFDEKTGIDLQGEVSSHNDALKKGSDFGFATSSFGQGIEMTPLQLAKAFCVFANGGRMVKPYVVEKITHGSDQMIVHPEVSNPVISQKTASEVTSMLINVVEKGFGNIARIPGYYLAGKTGTAEVPMKNKKGYYADKTIQSFIGFAPALKPQFLILVKLDNPNVPKSALSAAPIFKKLSQYIINYWQIPPDY